MAIQNFLSGGFYGKLGALVGQRWKNKRTLRVWVVPANPRTPAQMANRRKFSDDVVYSQMGAQMNYYTDTLNHEDFTKWNYRMRITRQLFESGQSGLGLIPLYPTTFTPPHLLSEISVSTTQGAHTIIFSTPDLQLDTDRVLSMMFALYDTEGNFLGYKLYVGYYYANKPGFITCEVDSVGEINNNCQVRIVSNDDEVGATDMIASGVLQVQTGSMDIHDFATSIVEIQKSATELLIVFSEPYRNGATTNTATVAVHSLRSGFWSDISSTGALENYNGYCAFRFTFATALPTASIDAFPSGAYITVTDVQFIGSSFEITAQNVTEQFSDDDLEREIADWLPDTTGIYGYGWYVSLNVPDTSADDLGDCVFKTIASLGSTATSRCFLKLETNETAKTVSFFPLEFEGQAMRAGDYFMLPTKNFLINGVTYSIHAGNAFVENNLTDSYFLLDKAYELSREGGDEGDPLSKITLKITIPNGAVVSGFDTDELTTDVVVTGDDDFYPLSALMGLTQSGSSAILTVKWFFDNEETTEDYSFQVQGASFEWNGYTYYLPFIDELLANF